MSKRKTAKPGEATPPERFANFCRLFMEHTKGPKKGKPFLLEKWQMEKIVNPLYGTLNPDGTRTYSTCYVEMGRKNGKSFLGAAVALYGLFTDPDGAEVISAAGTRDQAKLVFSVARDCVLANDVLRSQCKVYKQVIETKAGGVYKVVSADAFGAHGLNVSTLIFDEFWVQKTPLLYEALTSSSGARSQSLTFLITTSGFDKSTICGEVSNYARKVEAGLIDDPTFLPVIFGAPDDADWKDREVWKKANPNLGVSISMKYLEEKFIEAESNPSREIAFRQLFLSQWVTSESRWFSLDKIDAAFIDDEDWPEFGPDEEVCLGLDLSSVSDLTSLAAVWYRDGLYYLDTWSWVPEESLKSRRAANRTPYDQWVPKFIMKTPGEVVDYSIAEAKIDEVGDRWTIREVAVDRWNATSVTNNLQAKGIPVIGFTQNFASLSPASKDFEALTISGKLKIRKNPLFRWAFSNVTLAKDHAGNIRPTKATKSQTEKIDPVLAAIMALARSRMHNSGGQSTYEADGLLVL